ncbi:Phosphorylated carbohydrates phosphatase [Hordeum vulgare]|nr:Phosphorylated carbohydrates phosphatase [Hordeum vulgare]
MSSSGFDLGVTLCIALERSGSAPCRSNVGVGPNRSAACEVCTIRSPLPIGRYSARATVVFSDRSASPHAHDELVARAAHRNRQHRRERERANQSVCRRRELPTDPDEGKQLHAWVYRRLVTMAKEKARRLRKRNPKALRLAIEQLEREAS